MKRENKHPLAKLLDSELLPYKQERTAFDLWADIPAGRKMANAAAAEMLATVKPLSSVPYHDIVIGSEDYAELTVRVYRPKNLPETPPVLLWMHGGGFVMGSIDMDSSYLQKMASETACVIVSVDYRLAPGAPFPAAIDDCYAALQWLSNNADSLNVDKSRIAVGGLSGGAGLAAGLALYARDKGNSPIMFQLLMCPMIDDRNITASSHMDLTGLAWDRRNNLNAWAAYIDGDVTGAAALREEVSPYAAPSRCEDLSGLPPAFVSVGSVDLFMDENIAYARRLMQFGVSADLHVYAGAFHAFECIAIGSSLARRANEQIYAALIMAFSKLA